MLPMHKICGFVYIFCSHLDILDNVSSPNEEKKMFDF